jgi:hypothetical protein
MQTLLDHFDVSRLLGLTTRRVSKLVRDDAIPHLKLPNGEIRFDADDLQEWRDSLKNQQANQGEDAQC